MIGGLAAIARIFRRLRRDRRGGVLTTFALATPVIAVLALGAIDLASVSADKAALQDVADSAALQAAKQLGIADNGGLAERTKSVIAQQLAAMTSRLTYQTTVTPDVKAGTVGVVITANRTSFFVNLLPPGGWNLKVIANAQQMGTTPLCVLSFGAGGSDIVDLQNTAQILAPGCMVHSNSDVKVNGGASISAGVVQASGLASGPISPEPQIDAPVIDDPFADMNINANSGICSPLDLVSQLLPIILTPGVHCGDITALKSVQITLLPGEHIFRSGTLSLQNKSTLSGDNVVLVFAKDARFAFKDNSVIKLKGRRQGAYAGFVIATTRDNTNTFEISSSAARELLGTVYIPQAELLVSGANRVADQSAWTVVVAKSLKLKDNPDLVINSNYSGSNVPVPDGVGPVSAAEVRLAR
jgi:Flp pilus assembly protein TadG